MPENKFGIPEGPRVTTAELASEIRNRLGDDSDIRHDVEIVREYVSEYPVILRAMDQQDYIAEQTKFDNKKMFAEESPLERGIIGAGKGMRDIYEGGKQLVGLEDEGYAKESELYEQYSEGDPYALAGEIVGATAATIPLGGVGGFAAKTGAKALPKLAGLLGKSSGKIAKTAKYILPAATAGAVMGTIDYADENESTLQNALYGGLFGAGGELAAKLIGKIGKKAYSKLKGDMVNADVQDLVDIAAKHDVPLSFGDVTGRAKGVEEVLERVPLVGTGGFREKGLEKTRKSIEDVAEGLKAKAPSDDVGKTIQSSIKSKEGKIKKKASELYDKVEDLSGDQKLKASNTIYEGDELISELESSIVPTNLTNKIKKIVKNISGEDRTYRELRKARSDLGSESKKIAKTDPDGARKINRLRDAIELDMNALASVASDGTELKKAFTKANKFYKEKVIPFKETSIKGAKETVTPNKILNTMIKKGEKDKAKNFYNSLDADGKSVVRYGMVNDAIEKASAGGKDLSPAKFVKQLEDVKKSRDVFFKGKEKEELDGFIKLLKAAERHESAGKRKKIFDLLVGVTIAGGASGAGGSTLAGTAAATGLTAGALKVLLTTKTGRNLLISANKIAQGSPKMNKLIDRVIRQMETASGRASAKAGEDNGNDK